LILKLYDFQLYNFMTLRIGITCWPSIGGSGIVATELGHELARRGHEVHFISHGVPFRLDMSMPNIFFHEVSVNTYELFKYPDYTLPLAVKMAAVSRKYQLDILHVHYAVPHATAAYLAQQMLERDKKRPKIITTLHGTDTTLIGRDPNYRPIVRYSIEHSCGVTAVSQSLKEETVSFLKLKKPIEVIYNFMLQRKPTRSRAVVRRELGIADDELLMIHISNLRAVKRIPDLLKIISKLPKDTKAKLIILAGSSFAPFEDLVQKLKVEDRLIVRENVLDIENYLVAADAGLYTSDHETFGMGILESMNFAHPVLATRIGGIPEVIDDGKTGYLHEIGDIESYVKNIVKLAKDPELAKNMGNEGKKRAKKMFSAEKVVDHYLKFYERIIETDHC